MKTKKMKKAKFDRIDQLILVSSNLKAANQNTHLKKDTSV